MEASTFGNKGELVQGGARFTSEQGSDYSPGVSAESVGSRALFLGVVTLPPGKRTKAHVHEHHETALYMVGGEEVDLYTGPDLQHHQQMHVGDYFYIPANVLHVGVNRSATPAVFVGARNEATLNESLVLYADKDQLVP